MAKDPELKIVKNAFDKITQDAKGPVKEFYKKLSSFAVERAKTMRRRRPMATDGMPQHPFDLVNPPPGVVPPKGKKLAQDEGIQALNIWAGNALNSAFEEGVTWLGYQYLSLLTQRPEYRVITETIAEEMTREWIKIKSRTSGTGDPKEDKSDKIAQLEKEFKRLNVRDVFYNAAVHDGFFGRSHIYIDLELNGRLVSDDREELVTSIGDGSSAYSKAKIPKGSLISLRNVEPIWIYPTTYDSIDPLKADWYNPTQWFVMGKQVHTSRIPMMVGHPIPDILKPVYQFGGLSQSQMCKPYIDIWLNTRQAVADLIYSFSVFILMTDLEAALEPTAGGEDSLFNRIQIFNDLRQNQGLMIVNKESEDLKNLAVPLGTLDTLQAQSQEHMSAVSRIPLVKLLGISPHGLNASSEGEIRVFYDHIHAFQKHLFSPVLEKIFKFAQLSLWGEVDDDLVFDFVPLWSLDEHQLAQVGKTNAETDQIYVDIGVLHPEEVRKKVSLNPDSEYANIDVEDVPELKEEEEEGLIPKGSGGGLRAELGKGGEGEGEEHSTKEDSVAGLHHAHMPIEEDEAIDEDDNPELTPPIPQPPSWQHGNLEIPYSQTGLGTTKGASPGIDMSPEDQAKLERLAIALQRESKKLDPNSRIAKLAQLLSGKVIKSNPRIKRLASVLKGEGLDRFNMPDKPSTPQGAAYRGIDGSGELTAPNIEGRQDIQNNYKGQVRNLHGAVPKAGQYSKQDQEREAAQDAGEELGEQVDPNNPHAHSHNGHQQAIAYHRQQAEKGGDDESHHRIAEGLHNQAALLHQASLLKPSVGESAVKASEQAWKKSDDIASRQSKDKENIRDQQREDENFQRQQQREQEKQALKDKQLTHRVEQDKYNREHMAQELENKKLEQQVKRQDHQFKLEQQQADREQKQIDFQQKQELLKQKNALEQQNMRQRAAREVQQQRPIDPQQSPARPNTPVQRVTNNPLQQEQAPMQHNQLQQMSGDSALDTDPYNLPPTPGKNIESIQEGRNEKGGEEINRSIDNPKYIPQMVGQFKSDHPTSPEETLYKPSGSINRDLTSQETGLADPNHPRDLVNNIEGRQEENNLEGSFKANVIGGPTLQMPSYANNPESNPDLYKDIDDYTYEFVDEPDKKEAKRVKRARDEGGRFNNRSGFAGSNKRGFAQPAKDDFGVEGRSQLNRSSSVTTPNKTGFKEGKSQLVDSGTPRTPRSTHSGHKSGRVQLIPSKTKPTK